MFTVQSKEDGHWMCIRSSSGKAAMIHIESWIRSLPLLAGQAILEWAREYAEQEQVDQCEHEWVDADNQLVLSAEICFKCKRIRAKS